LSELICAHCFGVHSSLELNIHQQILSDIAGNVGECVDDLAFAREIIESQVQTRAVPLGSDGLDEQMDEQRVYMVSGKHRADRTQAS
jgi:phosphatidylinositol 4-kinase A